MPNSTDEPLAFRYDEPTKQEAVALKAMAAGEALPEQQQLVFQTIVRKFAQIHDLAYIPGDPDGTAFLNGRAFVGYSILKYIKFPASKLDNLEITQEPTQ